jgi:PqqD family protein of HPr-rel-A system
VRLRWFDAELAAFNPGSWETHILNAEGAAILARLALNPQRVADLLRDYRSAYPERTGPACDEALMPLLTDLVDLGLVDASEPSFGCATR